MTERLFQLSFFDNKPEGDLTANTGLENSSLDDVSIESEAATTRPIPTSPLVVPYKPRRKIRDEDYRSGAKFIYVDKSNPDPE